MAAAWLVVSFAAEEADELQAHISMVIQDEGCETVPGGLSFDWSATCPSGYGRAP